MSAVSGAAKVGEVSPQVPQIQIGESQVVQRQTATAVWCQNSFPLPEIEKTTNDSRSQRSLGNMQCHHLCFSPSDQEKESRGTAVSSYPKLVCKTKEWELSSGSRTEHLKEEHKMGSCPLAGSTTDHLPNNKHNPSPVWSLWEIFDPEHLRRQQRPGIIMKG